MLLVLKVMLWAVRSLTFSRQAVVLVNLRLRQELAADGILANHPPRGRQSRPIVARSGWVALRPPDYTAS